MITTERKDGDIVPGHIRVLYFITKKFSMIAASIMLIFDVVSIIGIYVSFYSFLQLFSIISAINCVLILLPYKEVRTKKTYYLRQAMNIFFLLLHSGVIELFTVFSLVTSPPLLLPRNIAAPVSLFLYWHYGMLEESGKEKSKDNIFK